MRPYLQNLKKKYNTHQFKILRGYESDEGKHAKINLLIIKTKEPRKGILREFCLEQMRKKKSIVIVNPITIEMVEFLVKHNFERIVVSEQLECGIFYYKNIAKF